jgi:hypothetical protein
MTGRDMITDFLNYTFLFLISIFFLFYVVLGNRLEFFQELMRMLLPFSIFGLLFLVVFRIRIINIKKYKKEHTEDDIIVYFTPADRRKDLVVRFGLPFIILFIPAFDALLGLIDIFQALLIFIINMAWHRFLFRPRAGTGPIVNLTKIDRIKDELFIYLLPLCW